MLPDMQVLIHGAANVNRAVDCDVVGIELLAEEKWSSSDAPVLADDEAAETDDAGEVEVCCCCCLSLDGRLCCCGHKVYPCLVSWTIWG